MGGRGFKSRCRHFFWISAVSHGLVPRVKSQLRKMEARQLTRWWFESTILRGDEDEYVIWINSKLPEVRNSREGSWDTVIIVTRMKSTKKEDGLLCKKKWLNGYTPSSDECGEKKNETCFCNWNCNVCIDKRIKPIWRQKKSLFCGGDYLNLTA